MSTEPPELNWCGHPMQEGESYFGGPEQIRKGCPAVLGAPANAPKKGSGSVSVKLPERDAHPWVGHSS